MLPWKVLFWLHNAVLECEWLCARVLRSTSCCIDGCLYKSTMCKRWHDDIQHLAPSPLACADGPPPIEVVIKLALQIAQGLQELHANGILYEDFKPQKWAGLQRHVCKRAFLVCLRLCADVCAVGVAADSCRLSWQATKGTLVHVRNGYRAAQAGLAALLCSFVFLKSAAAASPLRCPCHLQALSQACLHHALWLATRYGLRPNEHIGAQGTAYPEKPLPPLPVWVWSHFPCCWSVQLKRQHHVHVHIQHTPCCAAPRTKAAPDTPGGVYTQRAVGRRRQRLSVWLWAVTAHARRIEAVHGHTGRDVLFHVRQ